MIDDLLNAGLGRRDQEEADAYQEDLDHTNS